MIKQLKLNNSIWNLSPPISSSSEYGLVKLSDVTNSVVGGSGVAASQRAMYELRNSIVGSDNKNIKKLFVRDSFHSAVLMPIYDDYEKIEFISYDLDSKNKSATLILESANSYKSTYLGNLEFNCSSVINNTGSLRINNIWLFNNSKIIINCNKEYMNLFYLDFNNAINSYSFNYRIQAPLKMPINFNFIYGLNFAIMPPSLYIAIDINLGGINCYNYNKFHNFNLYIDFLSADIKNIYKMNPLLNWNTYYRAQYRTNIFISDRLPITSYGINSFVERVYGKDMGSFSSMTNGYYNSSNNIYVYTNFPSEDELRNMELIV